MGLLVIRISDSNENITISKEIFAQKLTLIRTTIYKDTQTGGQTYNGSVFVDLDFFNGFEVTTNLNDNFLLLPVSDSIDLQTSQYAQEFNSEDIRPSFNVKTYFIDATGKYTLAPIGAAGNGVIKYIDLYFQVSSQFDYNQY